ncbi:MAG: class I SAM-dependent methyltransferase [Candidatus Cloacimonadaceae bacterium]|nr:class I SAM-dependent methyltransferase [Candidatus Cloacimonadaceae bacterium]MDP3115137.1 class I SAM-dependent methyltransferase [Candidatus Cloacimonadaceae bacterium]
MKDVFQILNSVDAPLVLDAATGKGEFINVLKQNLGSYTQIIGIDASEKSVNYAQKVFSENDVEIYKMDLEHLQFEDDHFDLVCLSNSLHHLEHPDKVFAEMMRVLKPGGMMLVTEMYRSGEQTDAQQTHILMHHWIAAIDRRCGVFHAETFTKDEILAMAKKLHLLKLKVEDFYYPVDNPKEARNCETLRKSCIDTFKRLENIPDNEDLLNQGNNLMNRIQQIGCASASRLLITGYKKKIAHK